MRRCRYCPSAELHGTRFRPVDFPLLLLAIRRQRCEFCNRSQWTWLLPRPLRWGLAIVLLGVVYVGSTGPVQWLYDNYRMSDSTYRRIDRWVYWPINHWIDASQDRDSPLKSAFSAYRDWWAPPDESLRTNDDRAFAPSATTEVATEADDEAKASLLEFADRMKDSEHRVMRQTGEPP